MRPFGSFTAPKFSNHVLALPNQHDTWVMRENVAERSAPISGQQGGIQIGSMQSMYISKSSLRLGKDENESFALRISTD